MKAAMKFLFAVISVALAAEEAATVPSCWFADFGGYLSGGLAGFCHTDDTQQYFVNYLNLSAIKEDMSDPATSVMRPDPVAASCSLASGEGTCAVNAGKTGCDATDSGAGAAVCTFKAAIDWETCWAGGLKYHIHTKPGTVGFTSADCGSTTNAGHYDPSYKCGGATSETAECTKLYTANYKDDYSTGRTPDGGTKLPGCASTNAASRAECELGDLSSKYGLLQSFTKDTGVYATEFKVDPTVGGKDLSGMSLVYHCSTGERAFCAPLKAYNPPTMWKADFGPDVGSLEINGEKLVVKIDTSKVEAQANTAGPDPATIGTCSDTNHTDQTACETANETWTPLTWAKCIEGGLKYHIHEKWDGDGAAWSGTGCGKAVAGGHYDPAHASKVGASYTCTPAASWPSATADVDAYVDAVMTCEAGDLSGKWGLYTKEVDVIDPSLMFHDYRNGDTGMSIVFHCGKDGERAFCAKLKDNSPIKKTTDTSPADVYTTIFASVVGLFMML